MPPCGSLRESFKRIYIYKTTLRLMPFKHEVYEFQKEESSSVKIDKESLFCSRIL